MFLKFEASAATKAALAIDCVHKLDYHTKARDNALAYLVEYFKLPESPTPNAPTGDAPAS